MSTEICFDSYLNSVVSAYQQWWHLYTLSDATGRELHLVERDRISPAFFDFGLMVQTVEPPKAEQERELGQDGEKKEKIERLPVLEGICKYAADHVLLVGRPGSGKSTALARLLLQEAENALSIARAKIPVLVELRYLPSEANESSVCDRILAFMHKHDPFLDIDEAEIKQLLRQGRLLLLVDGVNELPSDRGRTQVNQFRELYQKTCPMIFTTRELSAGGDLGIAKRLEMQPLTEPQMQQFVMAYLPTQGERLLRQLSGRLREFGQTPLLLWMLCSLFQQSEQIPPNLGMVFRAFTVGYGDRIKQDVTLSKDSRAWWGRLLQYLAFKMTCGESLTELQVAISRREAEQFLVEFLRGKVEFADDCAVRWLEDLLKHHLIQISNDRIEFRHQLIQEYYAAEWLLGLLPSLSDARLQQVYLNYLKWTESLALMLELVESEEQAVRVVRLALEVDLRLGARLAGAVKYGFQEKTVGLLLREIEERKIPQLYAIELLGETRSDYAINYLTQALKDTNSYVCRSAAEALGRIGGEKVVEPLIQAFKDEDSYYIRRKLLEVLEIIGNYKVVEFLIQAFKEEKHPLNQDSLRSDIVSSLERIGSTKAIESLKYEDLLSYVKRHEADRKFLESFLSLRNKDSNNSNASEESKEFDKISNHRIDEAVKTLIRYRESPRTTEAVVMVRRLGRIYGHKVTETIISYLYNQTSRKRKVAAETLGKIGDKRAVEPLIQFIGKHPSWEGYVAAEALGRIADKRAVEPLIQALKKGDLALRERAAEALGKIGDETSVESLIQSMRNDDYFDVQEKAVEALGKIGSVKAIAPLIEVLLENAAQVNPEFSYMTRNATVSLQNIVKVILDRDLPSVTEQLPSLVSLIPTRQSQNALSIIRLIQSRCKYYNYNIAQTPLQETENHANPVERILQEIHQTLKTMSETGKYNFKADVVQIIENNSGEVIAKKYANDPALLQTINEITQVLADLQNVHPTANEAEAKDIIEAEFKEIQTNQPNRWTTFRQQLLNRERWLNGGKATISEITKHYAENSVFLKAGVAFLDGFSTDEE
jgi:HEAT repeat protein